MFDLFDNNIERRQFYYVSPTYSEFDERLFARMRVTPLKMTFSQFLHQIDNVIPKSQRALSRIKFSEKSSLSNFLIRNDLSESKEVVDYLSSDIAHIRVGMPFATLDPKSYYMGVDSGFEGIQAELDVVRQVTDTLLINTVLSEETEQTPHTQLFVIKGAAGFGKTTALKRTAWEAAITHKKLVLYISENGKLRTEVLEEIYELTKKRIYLFVDRASFFASDIDNCLSYLKQKNVKITIISAERDNEWNSRCKILDRHLDADFEILVLTPDEINNLLLKLEKNDSLGVLKNETPEDRFNAFKIRAKRQILVALHEATQGKSFEDILIDEYNRISPVAAQSMYLDICTLNRFDVPVRAGLIKRLTGIDFKNFENELMEPLEKIVLNRFDRFLNDRVYRTRHKYIAEIVFNEVLTEPDQKLTQLLRIMTNLEIGYSVDQEIFNNLTQYRAILNTFRDIDMGRSVFELAEEISPNDNRLIHQQGLFELHHPHGDITIAEEYLKLAEKNSPRNKHIQTSIASLYSEKSERETTQLMRDEYRRRALARLPKQKISQTTSHAKSVRLKILVNEVSDFFQMGDGDKNNSVLLGKMREIEIEFMQAYQEYGNSEHILSIEARYLTIVDRQPKALKALENAFNANKTQEWVALRLVNQLIKKDRKGDAIETLETLITANPSAKQAHLKLGIFKATSLVAADREIAIFNFRTARTATGNNFVAKLWYARELFRNGEFQQSRDAFEKLKKETALVSMRTKMLAGLLELNGQNTRFEGTVSNYEASYLLISSTMHPSKIYCSETSEDPTIWEKITPASTITFSIGFTFKGPVAFDISVTN